MTESNFSGSLTREAWPGCAPSPGGSALQNVPLIHWPPRSLSARPPCLTHFWVTPASVHPLLWLVTSHCFSYPQGDLSQIVPTTVIYALVSSEFLDAGCTCPYDSSSSLLGAHVISTVQGLCSFRMWFLGTVAVQLVLVVGEMGETCMEPSCSLDGFWCEWMVSISNN